jgi:DNA-directed RNA polymerase specialized sigma subunit
MKLNGLKQRSTQQNQELELWKRWKAGDQMALQELFVSLRPLIRKISNELQGNLPPNSIEAKVKREVLSALETYDPNMGVKLSTHIVSRSRKVLREVYKYQNVGRLPEATTIKIPTYVNLHSNMMEQFGREPTYGEIAKEMGTSVGEVRRLETGLRRDLSSISGEGSMRSSKTDKEKEILEHIYYELIPQEQQVLEHTFGLNNKQVLDSRSMAMRLGISAARISQIKAKIAKIVDRYYFGGV